MKSVAYTPHSYQKKAVKFLLENAEGGLLLDPGLGKTSATYAALKVLKKKRMFKGALVLAPLRPVYSVWPKERDKWADFNDFSIGILHGKDKEEVLGQQHDLYVMNFEGVDWLFGKSAKELKKFFAKVDVLVIDELSKFKHPSTGRFKLLKPHLGKFARRWGLTGSPASNGLMDLFGQCYVLDLGRSLGPYITHYRNKYFYPTGFGGYTWKLQEGAEKLIYKAIKPLFLRMEAEDYLEMPKLIPVTISVELPPAARKMYDEMEKELFAELDGDTFVAVTASSASVKCHQIANGALYNDKVDLLTGLPIRGKREWKEIHTAKLEALKDLIDELQGSPLLMAYHFAHDLERIVKTLGKGTPHTSVPAKKADLLINQWNRNELPYLFGHAASIGHGLNMQEGNAAHIGCFSIPWDYELYDQFIRRIRRQGNKSKQVFVYHIVAKDTIDEAIMRALHNKGKGQKSLLDALKTYKANKMKGLS